MKKCAVTLVLLLLVSFFWLSGTAFASTEHPPLVVPNQQSTERLWQIFNELKASNESSSQVNVNLAQDLLMALNEAKLLRLDSAASKKEAQELKVLLAELQKKSQLIESKMNEENALLKKESASLKAMQKANDTKVRKLTFELWLTRAIAVYAGARALSK